jgi:cytochrome c oxidase subunit I+III
MNAEPSSDTGFDARLLDRFPLDVERPPGEEEELTRIWAKPKGWTGWFTVVNNNYIGLYYAAAAFLFFCLAGVLALLIRAQLALPMNTILPQETFNQVFTMHGTMMMFLFAVPAVEALGIMLLPQMFGARDLPFPRLAAYAFWAYFVGGLCFFASIFFGLAPDGGWFMYPPLTSKAFSPGINADFWLLGIGFIEISAIAGAMEILVGILRHRPPGMSLDKMPIFAWAMLAFAVMIVVAFPAVILGTLLLELERALNWPFFDPTRGGDPLLWQHLFWFFGHPEVYIIFLPAAGIMSMIIPTVAKAPLIGHRLVVLAIIATGFISFGVWSHHMFATGMPTLSVNFFSAASMAVSVPAGLQVFAWIATAMAGKYQFNTPGLFALGALITFTMGGLTGVMLGLVPFDLQVHDTYFVVAHFHYVLIGGMVFPMLAAFYYWTPMMSKNPLSERVGRWVFGLIFAGTHITFLPMHLTGFMGMPRRVYTYLPDRGWDWPNLVSTAGAFMIAAGIILLLFDFARRFRFAIDKNIGNLFGGGTLEWLPTGLYSARSIPVVRSRYPLWDTPNLAEDVKQGRYLLPNAVTGRRETIITSSIRAEPLYLQILPGPSPWPPLAALFTAAFFLLLVVQAYWAGVVSGVLAIACIFPWVWNTDSRPDQDVVDVGGGIMLPTYMAGPKGHGWWGLGALLTVAGMIFAMALFSYIFLWSGAGYLWLPPPDQAWLYGILAAFGAALLLAVAAPLALRRLGRAGPALAVVLSAGSAIALASALAADVGSWLAAGLSPEASSQGAIVFALMAWQSVMTFVSLLMAFFIFARAIAGHVNIRTPTTVDLLCIFFGYTAVQGAIAVSLVRLFPGA